MAQPDQWVWLPRLQLSLPPPPVSLSVFPAGHNLLQIGFPSQAEPEKRKRIFRSLEGAVPGIGSPLPRGPVPSLKPRKEGTPSLCFLAKCCSGPRKMPVIAEGREQNPSAQTLGWNCAFLRPPFPPLYTLLFGSEIYPGLKRNSSSSSQNSLLP